MSHRRLIICPNCGHAVLEPADEDGDIQAIEVVRDRCCLQKRPTENAGWCRDLRIPSSR